MAVSLVLLGCALHAPAVATAGVARSAVRPARMASRAAADSRVRMADDHDILLRVARGEEADRTPVWLMRQAGRYMKAFRAISTKYPFRQRSETPDLAVELSLQPWHAFGMDGVIMFSDILTPLPGLGIEFDIISGKGPIIPDPIRSLDDVRTRCKPLDDPQSSHPFIEEILRTLRHETEGKCTLLGFVGAPWTLAAYSIEGSATKNCQTTKQMMYAAPEILEALLEHLTAGIIEYGSYQVRSGAQVLQLFDSWGQHLSPDQFSRFAKPYAERVIIELKARHPETPIIYFAHGSGGYLERQADTAADMLSLDWRVDMATARRTLGADVAVAGNIDPLVLFAPEEQIRASVRECIDAAGPKGHILNLGHGILQGTPEEHVAAFVDECKKYVPVPA